MLVLKDVVDVVAKQMNWEAGSRGVACKVSSLNEKSSKTLLTSVLRDPQTMRAHSSLYKD